MGRPRGLNALLLGVLLFMGLAVAPGVAAAEDLPWVPWDQPANQRCAGAWAAMYDRGRVDLIRESQGTYNLSVELFPAENPLASDLEWVHVQPIVNGHRTKNVTYQSGHSRPINEAFHARMDLLGRKYKKYEFRSPKYTINAGDRLSFRITGVIGNPNSEPKYIGEFSGLLTCTL